MNLRRKHPSDSLYMLLDTMCNAFGGIILLAVMVVLLTNKEKAQGTSSPASAEIDRLALAQTNLNASLRLESSLQAQANDDRRKQQMNLLSARKDLQDRLQAANDQLANDTKDLDSANAADPDDRLKFLNAALASGQTNKLAAQDRLAATRENIQRLQQRLAGMEKQVTAQFKALQRPLRLPMEHATDKNVVYVIVEYGRIYPCRNSDLSKNDTDINWESTLTSDTANPIPARGLAPGSTSHYFSGLSSDSVYVVFCVFEDSFPAFIAARKFAVENGITYGWEPRLAADGPVTFGSVGHTPKPQ